MLRQFPLKWLLHPDRTRNARLPCSGGQSAQKYVSAWVQRKHMCSQLPTAWLSADKFDVAWLRSWCLDSKSRLSKFEYSLKLNVLEIKAGIPYHELTMCLCLVGPLMKTSRVSGSLCGPGNVDICMRMIQQHKKTNGIPPTL